MRGKHNKKKWALVIVLVLIVMGALAFWQGLTVRYYKEQTNKISAPVRLAVLTDLHSTLYGEKQQQLIEEIRKQAPDVVLLIGDLVDEYVSYEGAELLLEGIGAEYPCYYVSGNHEFWTGQIETVKDKIRAYGVTVLEGTTQNITVKGQTIQLCGVDDPEVGENWSTQWEACLAQKDQALYTVLMSHRPERTAQYQDSGFDLVLAGHAHGGQVRIPVLLNGLYAPNQGLFPAYAGGQYALGQTSMIVSRGLSKSNLPRIFNPPELVIVEIQPIA